MTHTSTRAVVQSKAFDGRLVLWLPSDAPALLKTPEMDIFSSSRQKLMRHLILKQQKP
jgi:hypothetical protein